MHGAILTQLWPCPRPPRSVQWLTALGLGIAVATLSLAAAILLQARAGAWAQAEAASGGMATAMVHDLSRDITLCDRLIRSLQDAVGQTDIETISPTLRQAVLFDQVDTADYLESIVVLDANGDIIAESTHFAPRRLNFSDQDHFAVHRAQTDAGLFISRPFHTPARGGDFRIAISRRISRADGRFAGVVVATLRAAHLSGGYGPDARGSVTLFRSDGQVILRHSDRGSASLSDLSEADLFQSHKKYGADSETFTPRGMRLFYTFHRLPSLPLVLGVAVSVDDIGATWRYQAAEIGAALTVLCVMIVILSLLFRREIRRRLGAEDRLRDAAERMTVIATTDSLTGLANRRAFEERLTQEWLRAIRGRTSIALLILDADFFKLFNDRYGHPGGDAVLRSIAGCITSNVLRPADIGARYGGEEFVVLLPETEFQGAMIVAERIRIAVASLDIRHAAHPSGRVTVSIGVGVAYPTAADAAAALVGLADEALYQAKHEGRNRVSGRGFNHMQPPRQRHRDPSLGSDNVDVVLQ